MIIIKKTLMLIISALVILYFTGCSSNEDNPTEPQTGIFYVSVQGNDNDDGSQTQPWRTIQHGMNMLESGKTLLVTAGIYNEAIILTRSGQTNNPISIKNTTPGGSIISGTGLGSNEGLTFANGISHIKIEGIIIENFNGWGIFLQGNNSNIELNSIEARNCKDSGVRIDSANTITVNNLYSHNNEGVGLDCIICVNIQLSNCIAEANRGKTWMDGFAFENQSSDITLENCTAENNDGDGIDSKGNNTIVRNCTSKNNEREGIKLWGKNSRIEGCQSLNNGRAGIVLNDGGEFTMENTTVKGNGFRDHDYGMYVAYDEDAATTLRMSYNNIADNYGAVHFGRLVTLTYEDYDNFYSTAECEISAAFTNRGCYTRNEINNGTWYQETALGQHSTSTAK